MRRQAFRNTMLQVHLWLGLSGAVVLIVVAASGALLAFEKEINVALNRKVALVTPVGKALSLNETKEVLERTHPGSRVVQFLLPNQPGDALRVFLQPPSGKTLDLGFNQYTGEVLGGWNTDFMNEVYRLHTNLRLGQIGSEIVDWSALVLLFLALSGICLWWPRKRVHMDWGSSGTKFHFDLHNSVGILASVVLLLFGFTGTVMHWQNAAKRLAMAIGKSPGETSVPKIVPPDSGDSKVDPDVLLAIAKGAVPGAITTRLVLPRSAADTRAYVVLRYPEDRTPYGRTQVFLDPYRNHTIAIINSRKVPMAMVYVTRVNREIHTGDVYLWPTRVLACVGSLALPVLTVTGPLLWWYRRSARTRAQVGDASETT